MKSFTCTLRDQLLPSSKKCWTADYIILSAQLAVRTTLKKKKATSFSRLSNYNWKYFNISSNLITFLHVDPVSRASNWRMIGSGTLDALTWSESLAYCLSLVLFLLLFLLKPRKCYPSRPDTLRLVFHVSISFFPFLCCWREPVVLLRVLGRERNYATMSGMKTVRLAPNS